VQESEIATVQLKKENAEP